MIKKQNINYINKNISKTFHILSIKGTINLIGSNSIRNLLYTNDYDLNQSFNIDDTNKALINLYNHFLDIFNKCYKLPNYYITDFKCGEDKNKEPLRWSYDDMKTGFIGKYSFIECLKQDKTIKIDLVIYLNGTFVEITNNYFISFLKNKSDLSKSKQFKINNEVIKLKEEIDKSVKEKNYYNTLKRMFSMERIQNKVNENLLNFLNSDVGRLYKTYHDLDLLIMILEQTFKPIKMIEIYNNIEVIKEFASKIINIEEIENILNGINLLANIHNKTILKKELEKLVQYIQLIINKYSFRIMNKLLNHIK